MKSVILILCLLTVWSSLAQADLGPAAKALEATQKGDQITVVIVGTAYDKLCRYAFPRIVEAKDLGFQFAVINNDEVKGVVEGGNTKFVFTVDPKRPRCNFHKGDYWSNLIESPVGVLGTVTIIKKDGSSEPSLYIRDLTNPKQTPILEVTEK